MLLHCLLLLFSTIVGVSSEDVIVQLANSVHALEGSNITLSCSYTGSAYSLHWYLKHPISKPEFLLLIVESTMYVTKAAPPYPRLSTKLNKTTKQVDLELTSAEVTDSALYYCALQPTGTGVGKLIFRKGN
uniref:Ig-like domain-containing protein n=1 Tax=Anguilla anguilla TaxID=7936 RepID=A0A0E9QWH5_ANGAN